MFTIPARASLCAVLLGCILFFGPATAGAENPPEQPPCAYLELIETNQDTLSSIEIMSREGYRPGLFTFADGVLTVDGQLLAAARQAGPGTRPYGHINIGLQADPETGVFVLHRIRFTGEARESTDEAFYLTDTLPLVVAMPPVPVDHDGGFISAPGETARLAVQLRFWPGDIHVLQVNDEGAAEIVIGQQSITLQAGDTHDFPPVERSFTFREWGDGFDTIDLGSARFETRLSLKNYGCPSDIVWRGRE